MGIHDGHRQRLKKRFREEGLDSFTDIQVLELLLFYSIPRQDTNNIAHELLKHFGSLTQVMEASVEELEQVPGIGPKSAEMLHLVSQVSRFYMTDKAKRQVFLRTIPECGEYLRKFFIGRTVETVFLLCLDAQCKVRCCREVGEGSVNYAGVSTRKIVETALAAKATSVVLAHNHPSGIALPSQEDIQTTRRMAAALSAVEVVLVDHIIVADDNDYVSMAQSGYLFDERML